MDSTHIPHEILSHIFQHVPRRYLHRCLRVCKVWYHLAYREFYRQITLAKNINNDEIVKLLKESKFDNVFYGGQYVTKLVIKEVQPELLELLLPYLPKLCNIEFKTAEIFKKYEKALLEIDSKRKTSPLLLQKLQSISFPLRARHFCKNHNYLPICYQFRHTLIYLQLYRLHANSHLELLGDLTNIKYLETFYLCISDTDMTNTSSFDMWITNNNRLDTACPYLQQLCIKRKSTNQVIIVTSSRHDKKLKQTVTNNVFDKVVIINAIVYPKLIDVIKRKVQQLQILELRGCELSFDQNQNTTLDLRGMHQLQYLELQLYNVNLNNLIRGIFIQFPGTFAEEESVCYLWKKDQDDDSSTFWPTAMKNVDKYRSDELNSIIPLITLESSHYITNILFSNALHNTFNYKYSS